MGKNIKRFEDYIKESMDDELYQDQENEFDSDAQYPQNITNNSVDDIEEEDDDEYFGTKLMKELADILGTEVVDNKIEYGGKVINFFSETEKFHIDRNQFSSIEEVLDYLGVDEGGDKPADQIAATEPTSSYIENDYEDEEIEEMPAGSNIKRFNSFR